MARSRRQLPPLPARRGVRRGSGIAPIGGATLLVLVTLVLATAQRDSLPIRQAPSEARWSEAANTRQSEEAETRQIEPTKPSAPKFFGAGNLSFACKGDEPVAQQLADRSQPAPLAVGGIVRVALLNLPPPARF